MGKIKLTDRSKISLSDFRGVDFSSQMTNIKNFRASNMNNFINKYGANHKRNGWTEIVRALDENGVARTYISVEDSSYASEDKYNEELSANKESVKVRISELETLLSDYKGVLVDDTQKNKYYKFREFQYVAEDDVQHVEGQYIKGNTVHYRTMSIRWDTELDISKEDIIVIDNIPYMVGEIHESRRYAPRLVQTFRTELIEIHV